MAQPLAVTGGAITSLVTPFADDQIDEAAFRRLVSWQISEGTAGLLVGGAEGEGSSLTMQERMQIVSFAKTESGGAIPIIAAVLANATAAAIDLAKAYAKAGADALLLPCPYYNKPTPEGIERHFEAVARSVVLPILIDNRPSRCAVDLRPATMARLAALPGIMAVCDASGDPLRPASTRFCVPSGFLQLCGNDDFMACFNLNGGVGAISAIGNLFPRSCCWLQQACAGGDWKAAQRLQNQITDVNVAMSDGANPASLKQGLALLGRLNDPSVRLPEVAVSAPLAKVLQSMLRP